jgi:DNA-binding response OmpR family regulator
MTERPLVLVADDDDDIRQLLAIRLRRGGYEVITARDGEAALELAIEESPVAAVLDVVMPKLSGIDVAGMLRADAATRDIAIVLLTASVREEDVHRGYAAGADAYLRKPFDSRELLAAIEEAVVRRQTAPLPNR